MFEENDTVPVLAPRVVVETPAVSVPSVEYAKPDWVEFDPPVDVIEPLSVAEV